MALSNEKRNQSVANVLKRLREKAELTTRQAAGIIGVTHTTISHFENGRRGLTGYRIRPLEVVADSTNVMALECAVRRRKLLKENPKDSTAVKVSSSHRLVRVQKFSGAKATAHFRVFSMCSAGRDSGNYQFEEEAITEHISILYRLTQALMTRGYFFQDISIGLYGEDTILNERIVKRLRAELPDVSIKLMGKRNTNYYPTTSFYLNAKNKEDAEMNLADGGFTDWTQKLVGSSKERLMISGIGTDRILLDFRQAGESKQ